MNRARYSAVLVAVVAVGSCAYPDFAIESATDATGGVKHSGGGSGAPNNAANGGFGHGGASTARTGPIVAGGVSTGGLTGQAGLTGVSLGGNVGAATGGASALGGVIDRGGASPAAGSAAGGSVAGGPTVNGGTSFGGTASGGTVGRGGQAAAGVAGAIAGAGNQGGAIAGSAGATAQAGSPGAGTGAAAGALAGGGATGGGASNCGAQLLVNPNFDLGENGWTTYSSSGYTVVTSQTNAAAPTPAQTAPYFAWLGGHNNQTTSISQPISIPAGFTGATLSFYYYVATRETTTTKAYDVMTVELVEVGTGSVLKPLRTLSNLDVTSGWTQETISVTGALGGSTVIMRFYVTTGDSYVTDFCVDSVAFKLAPC